MRRLAVAVVALAVVVAPAACGSGTQLLVHSRTQTARTRTTAPSARTHTTAPSARTHTTAPSAQSVYLAQLGAAQSQLATAEQRIPTNPRTPAALARSVGLLAAAVRGLADGLAAIKPPVSVAVRHAQLVAIIRAYDAKLRQAARMAVARGGEAQAGALLISATTRASQSFTATIAAIDSTLASSPS